MDTALLQWLRTFDMNERLLTQMQARTHVDYACHRVVFYPWVGKRGGVVPGVLVWWVNPVNPVNHLPLPAPYDAV